MQAYFNIGEYKKNIDMREQEGEPGVYLGIYKVIPGDNVSKAIITGYLRDDTGNTAEWVDAVGIITLDTTPPDQLKNARAVGRNNLVLFELGKVFCNGSGRLPSIPEYDAAQRLSGGCQDGVQTSGAMIN